MDPVTAIGLVSGVFSFIGAAEKILKLSWTLYNSVEGSSEETQLRLELADSVKSISKRMVPTNRPASSEEDASLIVLAQECEKLANNIKKELQTLRPKRRKSKAQSSLAALKTLMLDPKIKDLEKQLERCRDELHFRIAALSRENLKALVAITREDGVKLTQLEFSISQLRQSMQDMTTMKSDLISEQALTQLRNLLDVAQDTLNKFTQDRILRGIKAGFEDMSYRYESIDTPFNDTFEWIFDLDGNSLEALKFTKWLSSGDGIFHICGKLGSGKSTLMKKLCKHEKTRTELVKWKGRRKLIMANFFFYALGSDPRQKSLMGLYRTLLYQILTTSPDLIQNLFPNQWSQAISQAKVHTACEILDEDIKQAYKRLSTQQDESESEGYCFSFFIDGLDEYQATTSIDRREMVQALINVAKSASGSFKICVSSRIENPFMDMLSEDTRLYLHELTKSDMKQYVRGNLRHIGTQLERRQLASSITKKAEGVFLWVVLVVQKIRRLSDDGAKFSKLIGEVESLPTEMNELFQRILDALGTDDRRLMGYTASILLLLGTVTDSKLMKLWLNLDDFYFLEDYATNVKFAEDAHFPHPETEVVNESVARARRRLRGVCRGLVEADKAKDLEFVHRSVGDFFKQEKVRADMHDKSFNNLEALSQLKLASMKHYWWDVEQQHGRKSKKAKKKEMAILNRHSILVPCLVDQRWKQQLDAPPFVFLRCLSTIPQLSVSAMINHALAFNKTAFYIVLSTPGYTASMPYYDYQICHTSRVRHKTESAKRGSKYWAEPQYEQADAETSAVIWRDADEDVDHTARYSIPVVSPLFSELCVGRLHYPLWRIAHTHNMPLEPDELVMLVYCAIGNVIGRDAWGPSSAIGDGNEDDHTKVLQDAGLRVLQHLLEKRVVSPNLLTYLSFGSEFGFIRIAARNQQLSIWQHFLCWWITVAAVSGDFIPESSTAAEKELSNDIEDGEEPFNDPSEEYVTSLVLETFIKNSADLQLRIEIKDEGRVPHKMDDMWYSYALKLILSSGKTLVLDVVVNINSRMDFDKYPYRVPHDRIWHVWHNRTAAALPDSPLPVRDWIDRSRLPNKDFLIDLIDKR